MQCHYCGHIFLKYNNNLKIRHVYHRPFVLPEIEFPPPKLKRFGVFVCERVFGGGVMMVVRKGGRGRGGRGKGVHGISQCMNMCNTIIMASCLWVCCVFTHRGNFAH
jgi:hypothetical protein